MLEKAETGSSSVLHNTNANASAGLEAGEDWAPSPPERVDENRYRGRLGEDRGAEPRRPKVGFFLAGDLS